MVFAILNVATATLFALQSLLPQSPLNDSLTAVISAAKVYHVCACSCLFVCFVVNCGSLGTNKAE